MFCKNCGKQVADNVAFCPECGTKFNLEANQAAAAPMEEPTVNSVPNQTAAQPVAEQPVNVNQAGAPADYNYFKDEAPVYEQPKKKTGKILLFVILPIIVALAVLVSPLVDVLGLFGDKDKVINFDSDSEYVAYVGANAIGEYTDLLVSGYGALTGTAPAAGMEADLALELGDFVTSMLPSMGGGMDLSFLKNIKMKMESDVDGTKGSGKLTLVLSGQEIATMEYIYDMQTQTIYIGCKELFDKYISINLSDLTYLTKAKENAYVDDYYDYDYYGMSTSTVLAAPSQSQSTMASMLLGGEFAKYLPSEDQVAKLLDKYIDVALGQITDNDISKKDGSITANGVTQDCTVFDLKITPEFVQRVFRAVLETAKDDAEIISIIEKFISGAEALVGESVGVDVIQEYKNGIDELLDDLNDMSAPGEYVKVTGYVNSKYEIIGCEINTAFNSYGDEEKVFAYLSAENGGSYGFDLGAEDLSLKGKGKKNGNAITADYSLVVEGEEMLKFSLENFSGSLKEGKLNGSVTLKLGTALSKELAQSAGMDLSMYDPAIKLDFNTNSKGGSFGISLLAGENLIAKMSCSGKTTNANVAATPAPADTVKADQVEESDLNLNKILENLQKAGFPTALLTGAAMF